MLNINFFVSILFKATSAVMTPGEGLTAEQIATFERDGYLIIPNALPKRLCHSF